MPINRRQRYADESVSSYLYRVALANYKTVGVLTSRFGITRAQWLKNTYSKEQLTKIATELEQSKNEIYEGTHHAFEVVLGEESESYFLKNRMKFCSVCINEQLYHRTIWGLKPITICIKHCCRLNDFCSNCQQPVKMDQFMSGICHRCRHAFIHSNSVMVPYDSIEYKQQSEFQASLISNSNNILVSHLGCISAKQFLRLALHSFYLLEQLPSFIDESRKANQIFYNRRGGEQRNDMLTSAYAQVYWMYQEFPHRFQSVLRDFSKKPRNQNLYNQMKAFELLFSFDGFEKIKAAYDQFWISELEHGNVRRDRSIFKQHNELLVQRTHFRKEELKRLTGMSYPKIESLQQAGIISIKIRERGRTTQYFIDKTSFLQLQEERQRYINKLDAARILGIQVSSVGQLLQNGLLREIDVTFSQKKMIVRIEVEQLLKKSSGEYSPIPKECIPFRQVFNKYSVIGLTLTKLICFIHQKIVRPKLQVLNGTLADTWYLEDELLECVKIIKQEKQNNDGMYMQDVMQYLGIGEKKMKTLMKEGKLKPDRVIIWKDGRKRYLFRKERIFAFKNNIQTSAE